MDDAWFREFVARSQWVFAKTMPQSPHWYTLRRTHRDQSEFDRAVLDIRAAGYVRRFRGRDYVCHDLDGWRYWTMGAPVHSEQCPGTPPRGCDDAGCTILINRARNEEESGTADTLGAPPR